MVAGPGSSGQLATAYINQLRGIRQKGSIRPPVVIDMQNIDFGIEAMLDEAELGLPDEVEEAVEVPADDTGL
jgi:hypothetical protein